MPIIRFLRRRIINASNTSGPPADDLNNDSCPLPSLLLPTVQLMQISNIIYLPVGGWSVRFCIPEVFFPLEDWGPVSSPGGYFSRQCFCNWNVKARKETLLFPPDFLKEKTFHEIFFRAAALAASPKKGVSAPEIFEQVRQKGEGGGDVSWGQKGKKKKRPPSVSPLLLLLDVWPVTVLTRSSRQETTAGCLKNLKNNAKLWVISLLTRTLMLTSHFFGPPRVRCWSSFFLFFLPPSSCVFRGKYLTRHFLVLLPLPEPVKKGGSLLCVRCHDRSLPPLHHQRDSNSKRRDGLAKTLLLLLLFPRKTNSRGFKYTRFFLTQVMWDVVWLLNPTGQRTLDTFLPSSPGFPA